MMRWSRRIGILILVILEFICLGLPHELKNLYETRMGFMRQILYMNSNYPMTLVYWALGVLGLLGLGMLFWLHRRYHSQKERPALYQAIWLVLLGLVLVVVLLVQDASAPLYFYNLICVALAILLQLIVSVVWRKVDQGA